MTTTGNIHQQEGKIEEYYDTRSGLWYRVRWDEFLQRYVWTIAPHQKLILDSTAK